MGGESESLLAGIIPHIEELRRRIVFLAIAFLVLFFAGYAISQPIITLLSGAFSFLDLTLVVASPLEYVAAQIKVAMVIALLIEFPLILYHVLCFVVPALKPGERRWLLMTIPVSLFLFALGVSFSILVLRMSLWMLSLLAASSGVENYWSLSQLISIIVSVALFFGLLFQMPLVLLFLGKVGIVRRETLTRSRKLSYFIIFIFAAVITPTVDPVTMLVVALPMVLLFEISILLMRIMLRGR